MANSRAISLLPAVLLLAGCPVYGSGPVTREVQVSCVTDLDCPTDTFCDPDANACIAYDFGICLTDGDCPVGSYCERADGGCYIPAVPDCGTDVDCGSGFECDFRSTCRPETFAPGSARGTSTSPRCCFASSIRTTAPTECASSPRCWASLD